MLLVLLLTFPLVIALWFYYYRKIIKAGIDYVGQNPYKLVKVLEPQARLKVKTEGKVTVIVDGVNPWIVVRKNGGPSVRAYKIRLFSGVSTLELTNPSNVFSITVTLLCETKCEVLNL